MNETEGWNTCMIYRVSYLSSHFRVKGYLALPDDLSLTTSEISDYLECHYQTEHLRAEPIACTWRSGSGRASASSQQHDMCNQRWPVLLYCRGGLGQVGKVKLDWMALFAERGYLVFAPAYRGNEGGEGRDEFGGADREDVCSAYRWLRSLAFADPARITVMGFSRGALNASITAAANPGVYRLVLWSGVADLTSTYEQRTDLRRMLKRVIGGSPVKAPEAYRSRSPIHMADQIQCPVLIMHGSEDPLVHVSHGLAMVERLRLAGKQVDLHLYLGQGHLWPSPLHEAAIERMFDWIAKPMLQVDEHP
jgi:dipeptidyl aminopeptidase/acylaminoacyl peptidase